jgi:SAM-dependent methyltransferase
MLTHRSQEKELIDLGPDYYTHHEYIDCLKKLFHVNKILGFFNSTVKLFRLFPKNSTVVDVGCGGGLFLLHLSIDISSEAINLAQLTLQQWQTKDTALNVRFQLQSQPELILDTNSIDILLATLVCHHLTDNELINFLQLAFNNARQAVIINDLHRHYLPVWFYSWLSPILFRNRLITHDGLISIKRGFTRAEWKLLLRTANIHTYQIKWCFPFRWRIILWKC